MKWKKFVCAISIISMLFSASQVVYASYDYISKDTTNIVTISNIGIELVYSGETADILTLGMVMHKEVAIKNVGKKPVYVRLRFDKYWSETDAATGEEGERISSDVCNPEFISFETEQNEDWTYNTTDGCYYYRSLLDVGDTTSAIAYSYEITDDIIEQTKDTDGNITATKYKDEYQNRQGNVTAYGEAVQEISEQFVYDYIMFASEDETKVVGWDNDKIKFDSTALPEVSRDPVVDTSAQPNVEFADDASEFITVHGDNLFLNMNDLLPGDTKSQDITIENNSDEVVDIYMYAKRADNDYDSPEAKEAMELLLQNIELQVGKIENAKDEVPNEIYKGDLGQMSDERGEDNMILLGNFKKGDKVDLRASVTLNPDWNIGNAETKIIWVFLCRKLKQDVNTYRPILPAATVMSTKTPEAPTKTPTEAPTQKPVVTETPTPSPVATDVPTTVPTQYPTKEPVVTKKPTPSPISTEITTATPAPTPKPTKGMIGEDSLDDATAQPPEALPTDVPVEKQDDIKDPNGNVHSTSIPSLSPTPTRNSLKKPYTKPKTGDENRLIFWGVIFIISLIVFSVTVKSGKRQRCK